MPSKIELLQEKGRKALAFREFWLHYDQATYVRDDLFEAFKKSKDQNKFLKLIWAFDTNWPGNPLEIAKICPDVCPIYGTPLDYGKGKNRVFNPLVEHDEGYFQPTIDHIKPRIAGGEDQVSNYIIVCRKFNTRKNDMEDRDELDLHYDGYIKTYFA